MKAERLYAHSPLLVMCSLSLFLGVQATRGLKWPHDADLYRNMAQAQTIADGHFWADPYYGAHVGGRDRVEVPGKPRWSRPIRQARLPCLAKAFEHNPVAIYQIQVADPGATNSNGRDVLEPRPQRAP